MLTREESELLTRVGPGTPMGELMRRYWIPAGTTREIAEPDGPPVRVRLLGEDLVMFRDSSGKVGLLAESCAHRRASLFFGRNEEGGLTCVYHGWKYDAEGNVLDTPCEPLESRIRYHVKQPAYPTFEKNGLILTYMGPKDRMPLIPNYEWLTLPEDYVFVEDKIWNENNWLQGLEGDNDSAHVQYLHRNNGLKVHPGMARALSFDTDEGEFWVKTAAIRHISPSEDYVRTNFFMLPCMAGPPQQSLDGLSDGYQAVHQVPADDTHTWRIDVWTRRSSPLQRGRGDVATGRWPEFVNIPAVGNGGQKFANKNNDYLISRERQKTDIYTGIPMGPHTQDAVMTESMGPISDRWNEHLGMSDAGPVAMRRVLLRVVRAFMEGKEPPGLAYRPEDNHFVLERVHAMLPPGTNWKDLNAVQANLLDAKPPAYI
jgi:nitrite reductase/ring-hydroxylating ferredoxin subunit